MSPMRFATPAAHRAASPRVYLAAMVLLNQRPCLMIAEPVAPARAIRRARPTPPLWPLNPSPKPAAVALTRWLTVLSSIPKTEELASPRSCLSSSKAVMARRVMNTTSPSPV